MHGVGCVVGTPRTSSESLVRRKGAGHLLLRHALRRRLLIHQLRNRIEVIDDEKPNQLDRVGSPSKGLGVARIGGIQLFKDTLGKAMDVCVHGGDAIPDEDGAWDDVLKIVVSLDLEVSCLKLVALE